MTNCRQGCGEEKKVEGGRKLRFFHLMILVNFCWKKAKIFQKYEVRPLLPPVSRERHISDWRSSVTAALGIDVKVYNTSSLQNVTPSHTTYAYIGETKRKDNARSGMANMVMQRSPPL